MTDVYNCRECRAGLAGALALGLEMNIAYRCLKHGFQRLAQQSIIGGHTIGAGTGGAAVSADDKCAYVAPHGDTCGHPRSKHGRIYFYGTPVCFDRCVGSVAWHEFQESQS
jgi:hypothetical protein